MKATFSVHVTTMQFVLRGEGGKALFRQQVQVPILEDVEVVLDPAAFQGVDEDPNDHKFVDSVNAMNKTRKKWSRLGLKTKKFTRGGDRNTRKISLDMTKLATMRSDGRTLPEIAKELGCSVATVSDRIHKYLKPRASVGEPVSK